MGKKYNPAKNSFMVALSLFLVGVILTIISISGIVQTNKFINEPTFLEAMASSTTTDNIWVHNGVRKYVQSSEYQTKMARERAKAKKDRKYFVAGGCCGCLAICMSVVVYRQAVIMRKQYE